MRFQKKSSHKSAIIKHFWVAYSFHMNQLLNYILIIKKFKKNFEAHSLVLPSMISQESTLAQLFERIQKINLRFIFMKSLKTQNKSYSFY